MFGKYYIQQSKGDVKKYVVLIVLICHKLSNFQTKKVLHSKSF